MNQVQAAYPALSSQLREQVRLLERRLGILNDAETACCGVTLAQCHALVEIGHAGSLSLNSLADSLGLDSSTTSRTVQQLVQGGRVLREAGTEDRRTVVIRLTEAGEREFEQIEGSMNREFERILLAIPENRRMQVVESLELLLKALPEDSCCEIEDSSDRLTGGRAP